MSSNGVCMNWFNCETNKEEKRGLTYFSEVLFFTSQLQVLLLIKPQKKENRK